MPRTKRTSLPLAKMPSITNCAWLRTTCAIELAINLVGWVGSASLRLPLCAPWLAVNCNVASWLWRHMQMQHLHHLPPTTLIAKPANQPATWRATWLAAALAKLQHLIDFHSTFIFWIATAAAATAAASFQRLWPSLELKAIP